MVQLINQTITVVTDDGRNMTGKLVVFDKHMNVVMCDVKETRMISKKSGELAQRTLGLILLRGEHVVSLSCAEKRPKVLAGTTGSGIATKKTVLKRDREAE
eukprot:CAMPEP_0176411046 /NCGR_PEP_ID=MMETSP0127-20121128/3391_1 /TAXON_ID=938130 /ORGANISM="Platyophrya macrostoma, Strain WH" /LENGTH=100 /DNA_ID=CAMNT_0017790603 /DNA_START=99 /DNA_END=401 /DNA_ORIENTATION=+